MNAGARGFIVKDAPGGELAAAVRRVAAGEVVLDPALAVASLSAGPSPLTDREADGSRAALPGATIADMADTVHVSPGTVRNCLSTAIGKTGGATVPRRRPTVAVRDAARRPRLSPGPPRAGRWRWAGCLHGMSRRGCAHRPEAGAATPAEMRYGS